MLLVQPIDCLIFSGALLASSILQLNLSLNVSAEIVLFLIKAVNWINGKSEVGSGKWKVGNPKTDHAALSLNGQKSEIRSSNFVKSQVWSLKYEA